MALDEQQNSQINPEHGLSARGLMKLPPEERQRRVKAAIESSADEDFEIFEAYSEESEREDSSSCRSRSG
jgi:hypothetical protein